MPGAESQMVRHTGAGSMFSVEGPELFLHELLSRACSLAVDVTIPRGGVFSLPKLKRIMMYGNGTAT